MEIALVVIALVACVLAIGFLWQAREVGRLRATQGPSQAEFETLKQTYGESERKLTEVRVRLEERDGQLKEGHRERDRAIEQRDEWRKKESAAQAKLSEVSADHKARVETLEATNKKLREEMESITARALRQNTSDFLKLAGEQFKDQHNLAEKDLKAREQAVDKLVAPMGKALEELGEEVRKIEAEREKAYSGLQQQVDRLSSETGGLREILRSSQLRGSWGEKSLENVLELAGMRKGFDYETQVGAGGGVADVVVRMPGGKKIVIDSKVPFDHYRRALDASDDAEREKALVAHAKTISDTAADLSSRNYDEQTDDALDIVVMWVPSDAIVEAATRVQPTLMEDTYMSHRVLIATPVTMIALLNGVAAALQQERLHENALEIQREAQAIYDSLRRHAGHYATVGRRLNSTVNAFNEGVGSMQGGLLRNARSMRELGGGSEGEEIKEPGFVDASARNITEPELLAAPDRPDSAASAQVVSAEE